MCAAIALEVCWSAEGGVEGFEGFEFPTFDTLRSRTRYRNTGTGSRVVKRHVYSSSLLEPEIVLTRLHVMCGAQ